MPLARTLLLVLTISGFGSLNAQIVFALEDLPQVGDEIVRYVDTVPMAGPGNAGADQAWDFSEAVLHLTVTTSVGDPTEDPNGDLFPGADLTYVDDIGNTVFLSATSDALTALGGGGDPLGMGEELIVQFDPTLTIHELPRTFGDHFTDDYRFELIIDGSDFGVHSVRVRHYGTVFDSTDAYGAITTPEGTYDCLRVKSTEVSTDSVWVKIFVFAPWTLVQDIGSTNTVYSWLAKETKLPVAEMTLDSLGLPATFTWSSLPPDISTDVASTTEVDEVRIYPQPAVEGFLVEWSTAHAFREMRVFAMDGRSLSAKSLVGTDRLHVGTSDWAPGMYLLQLLSADGSPPVVKRVLVQ